MPGFSKDGVVTAGGGLTTVMYQIKSDAGRVHKNYVIPITDIQSRQKEIEEDLLALKKETGDETLHILKLERI